jgi:hypothetical protein
LWEELVVHMLFQIQTRFKSVVNPLHYPLFEPLNRAILIQRKGVSIVLKDTMYSAEGNSVTMPLPLKHR